jgi:hypothetical protein
MCFWTLSIVRRNNKCIEITFRKLSLLPSSGEERETPILLGHLKRANLNRWTSYLKH